LTRKTFYSPSLLRVLDFKLQLTILILWVGQYHPIGWHQNRKKENGNHLGNS